MSRPESVIDWKKLDDLLISGCTGMEVAGYFGIHYNTLYERVSKEYGCDFSEYRQSKLAKGESLLRSVQFAKAIGATRDGDNTMLIWLGKNRLKQSDGVDITFSSASPSDIIKAIEEKKQVVE